MSFNTTTKAIQLISKNVNQYLNHKLTGYSEID